MPGGFVCSGSLKGACDRSTSRGRSGSVPVRKLFSKEQRAFYRRARARGLGSTISRRSARSSSSSSGLPAGSTAGSSPRLWLYPDGSRILELSTKCGPDEAFQVAAEIRAFLAAPASSPGEQQTKTRKALDFFSAELAPQ